MSRKNRKKDAIPSDFTKQFSDLLDEALEKGMLTRGDKARSDQPQSLFVNPYDYYSTAAGNWKEKPATMSFSALRLVSIRNPIVAAIINTRVQQVAAFSSPARLMELGGNNKIGFQVVHRDPEHKLTPGEKNMVLELEDYVTNCGFSTPKSYYDRDKFDAYLRKTVRDSLTFDAATTELVPTSKGRVAEFHAVDAETIRFAKIKQDMEEEAETAFVQLMNGQICTEYGPHEMMYGIRNPTTDVRSAGYGISEIEMMVTVVTNIFSAMTHNAQFFRQGAGAKGLLNIKPGEKGGGVQREQFESFKRTWDMLINGSAAAWRTPVVQAPDVQFVNMGANNRDMEFSAYLEFLVKLATGIFQISPDEINFNFSSSSAGSSPLFESSPEAKLKFSKDKGLRPLLQATSRWINEFIMYRTAPEFVYVWAGLEQKDERELIDLRTKEVASYKTIDQIREEAGDKPIGEENGGNLILNPQYIQWLTQKNMMEAAQQQGDNEQPPDDEGGSGSDAGADEKSKNQDDAEEPEEDLFDKSLVGVTSGKMIEIFF